MDETIILPSPNWFQVSGLAVTRDGWIVYSGPSKSLCVLEPLPSNYDAVVESTSGFRSHVVNRAHPEKIISIDISPEWPEKRSFLTGSADGSVKQWLMEYDADNILQIKSTHVHDVHKHEKEEITGVGYSNATYAITVGVFGNIVKWDINSNVVMNYSHFLKNFKPTCMTCSHHVLLNIAVGTKQGVVFVIDLNAPGQIIYKVRSNDEEISNLSWCPQFEVGVKKSLNSALSARLEKIRNEPEPNEEIPELKPFNVTKTNTSHLKNLDETNDSKNISESEIVQEDDMFDIYKDHEADEFGHKKYEPEEMYVKVKSEKKDEDFLAECLRLKNEIIQRKNEPEPTIESLVEALDNTHVASGNDGKELDEKKGNGNVVKDATSSLHIQRHLLAAIGKHGGLKIYSKSGKLVSSCFVPYNKHSKNKPSGWTTLLWYKPDCLLAADGKSQLIEVDPLKVDCKNKLEYKLVHSLHRRGLYCIASASPKVFNIEGNWNVWSVGQDRQLIEYSLSDRKAVRTYMTCGGFVYNIAPCPYDANKIAVAVGDGAVRVWEAGPSESDNRLGSGRVTSHWQNVLGKVLTLAWHPSREGLLAFATAEARVGLIETSGKTERAAKVLSPASSAVYSICWGTGNELLVASGGSLLSYDTNKIDEAPKQIPIEVEGAKWKISSVYYHDRATLVGSQEGAVALLDNSRVVLASVYPFTKVIHSIDWHPQQVSDSVDESPYKNLIAVSSNDKSNEVAILEVGEKEDGSIKLSVLKSLSGHRGAVHEVTWSPHHDATLMTSSQDGTVRIWNVVTGVCQSIFGGHAAVTLGAAWSPQPSLGGVALTGGGDCCMRLWRTSDHPAEGYVESKPQSAVKKEKKKRDKTVAKEKADNETDDQVAAKLDTKLKVSKKILLRKTYKKIASNSVEACKKLLMKHLEKNGLNLSEDKDENSIANGVEDPNSDYIRLFGTINEVNELLDEELSWHEEHDNPEAYILLCALRGCIDQLFRFAEQRDLICPFILSMAPCVSFKYWKDATQLYLAQIDRLVAKGEEKKLEESKQFGGPVYRKVVALLSVHDVKGAVDALTSAYLYKEAYALCRVRHMDSIAEEVLASWARQSYAAGLLTLSAACYIALGDLQQASFILGKSTSEAELRFAAILAKYSGQRTLAEHITEKTEQIRARESEELNALPTRMELLMREKETADVKDVAE